MSKLSQRVIVFANNEDKRLREYGRAVAAETFPGLMAVNRSPRFFDPETYSAEPCTAILIEKSRYPELAQLYKGKQVKVLDLTLPKEEKTPKGARAKKAPEPTLTLTDSAAAEERE